MPPGWKRSWHAAVRAQKSGVLLAFISAIPARLRLSDREQTFVEINFLCVHKKLRTKRLAPVMIMEITRRVHLEGIFQAAFTAGVFLPTPVACCRYAHHATEKYRLRSLTRSVRKFRLFSSLFYKFYVLWKDEERARRKGAREIICGPGLYTNERCG